MTAVILPGQEFTIKVDGIRFEVKALSGKQQVELAKHLQGAVDAETQGSVIDAMEAAKAILDFIFGREQGDQYWSETVDAGIAIAIAQKVFSKAALDADEVKN